MSVRARVSRIIALALMCGLAGCAGQAALKRAQTADSLRDYDLAVAQYMRALRERPNDRNVQLALDRAKLRASDAHFASGRRFYAQGRYQDALVELQLATELNPANADADASLRLVRVALRSQIARPEGGPTALESLLARGATLGPEGHDLPDIDLPAQVLTGQQATVRTVYLTIAKLAGWSVLFDPQFRDAPAPVGALNQQRAVQALDTLATLTNTFYRVTGPSTLLVIPNSAEKRREYADEVVRQFTVQNADLKETMDALRVVADARYIAPVTGINAILVRDTPERMQVIGRFIGAFDKARPEVVIDVEVLEVDRTRLREYGLQIASPGALGVDGAVDVNREGLTLESLRNLSQADVLMTNIPALYYRLLKTDSRTRTLANPHIRITDGIEATANFGQEVPVPRTVIVPISQGGPTVQPQTQFDYRTIGVNIRITPRTHANDDVTLALNIELSSLGAPGFDGLPTFGKRNVSTSIRLKDGETNILAGLIREDERSERQTIPGLGDIPVVGNLFARNHTESQQTDVVVMLTPHIIRVLDLTEEDLRPLRLPREGTGTNFILPPTPTQTPPRLGPPSIPDLPGGP